jgi:hypothetical protein
MPLRSLLPRSSSSNRLPRSFRVPSPITTVLGSAMPCNRAARFSRRLCRALVCRPNRSSRRQRPARSRYRRVFDVVRWSSVRPPLRSVPAPLAPPVRRHPRVLGDGRNTRTRRRPYTWRRNRLGDVHASQPSVDERGTPAIRPQTARALPALKSLGVNATQATRSRIAAVHLG